jgi:hypothetical protein
VGGGGGGCKKSFFHVAYQNNGNKKYISMGCLAGWLGCGCGQGARIRGCGCWEGGGVVKSHFSM